MTRVLKKALTLILALALALALAPLAAQAQSLLQDSLAQAYENGQRIKATVSLEVDDGLAMLIQPPETFSAIQGVLAAATLEVYAVKGESDTPEIVFSLAIQGQEIVSGRAWLQDDTMLVTTNLLPGKTLMFQGREVMQALQPQISSLTIQADTLQAIGGALEKYLSAIMLWMDGAQGMMIASESPVPATDQRDSASESVILTVTPEQLKALCVALAQEFVQDVELQQALGAADVESGAEMGRELLLAAQEMEPTGDAMVWSLFMDDQGELVGVDGVIPATFGDIGTQGSVTYNRKTQDAQAFHDVQCKLEYAEGGVTFLRVAIGSDETDAQAPKGNLTVRIFQQEGGDGDSADVILTHQYASTHGAGRETRESQTSLQLTAKTGAAQTDASEDILLSMMAETHLSVEAGITSDTRVLGDGFTSETVVNLSFSGLKLGRARVTLTTDAYAPTDTSDTEVIDVFSLDDTGGAALTEELKVGFMQAVMNVMMVLPPKLQQMMQAF